MHRSSPYGVMDSVADQDLGDVLDAGPLLREAVPALYVFLSGSPLNSENEVLEND